MSVISYGPIMPQSKFFTEGIWSEKAHSGSKCFSQPVSNGGMIESLLRPPTIRGPLVTLGHVNPNPNSCREN